jgi:hypothetical protein
MHEEILYQDQRLSQLNKKKNGIEMDKVQSHFYPAKKF